MTTTMITQCTVHSIIYVMRSLYMNINRYLKKILSIQTFSRYPYAITQINFHSTEKKLTLLHGIFAINYREFALLCVQKVLNRKISVETVQFIYKD